MKRVVGTVIGLAVVLAVLFIPALFWNSGSSSETYEETSITTYVADFTVDEHVSYDGVVDVELNVHVRKSADYEHNDERNRVPLETA